MHGTLAPQRVKAGGVLGFPARTIRITFYFYDPNELLESWRGVRGNFGGAPISALGSS